MNLEDAARPPSAVLELPPGVLASRGSGVRQPARVPVCLQPPLPHFGVSGSVFRTPSRRRVPPPPSSARVPAPRGAFDATRRTTATSGARGGGMGRAGAAGRRGVTSHFCGFSNLLLSVQ